MEEDSSSKHCTAFHSPHGCIDSCCDRHELSDITKKKEFNKFCEDIKHKMCRYGIFCRYRQRRRNNSEYNSPTEKCMNVHVGTIYFFSDLIINSRDNSTIRIYEARYYKNGDIFKFSIVESCLIRLDCTERSCLYKNCISSKFLDIPFFAKNVDKFVEGEICSICQDDSNDEQIIKLNCGHQYHRNCIARMFDITNIDDRLKINKCPLCSEPVMFNFTKLNKLSVSVRDGIQDEIERFKRNV